MNRCTVTPHAHTRKHHAENDNFDYYCYYYYCMFTHKKIQTLQTQRQTHFTDSQPCFINEMEKQSKNMIYRSLYITKLTNVHKTVFTHQTTALKMFCHRKKPHRYHSKVHKKTFRKESYNLFKTDI